MPSSETHQKITRAALIAVPGFEPFREPLAERFSLAPDLVFTSAGRHEFESYCRQPDGSLIHQFPAVDYGPLYRDFRLDETAGPVHAGDFVNAHFKAAVSAFTRYFRASSESLRAGKTEAAARFAGVLAHVLQDGVFGLHALESGGIGIFSFESVFFEWNSPAAYLAGLCADGCPEEIFNAEILGNTPESGK